MSDVLELDDVSPAELLDLLGRATTGADVSPEEVTAFLEAGHDKKTEKRVLKWLSKVAKKARDKVGLGEPEAEVVVHRARHGRVAEWRANCLACTKLDPARSKRAAELGAIAHLRTNHESVGRIVVGG